MNILFLFAGLIMLTGEICDFEQQFPFDLYLFIIFLKFYGNNTIQKIKPRRSGCVRIISVG